MAQLVLGAGLPSLAIRRLLGRHALGWRGLGPLRRADPGRDSPPPGEGWHALQMRLAGICGSDIAALTATSPTVLWPLVSFPSVPGHEIVADLAAPPEAPAAGASGGASGRRVVVDPFVSCLARGELPCPECGRGLTALCRRAPTERAGLARGMMIGYHRDLPGGWSDRLWAHESQLHPVPDDLPDEVAVLVEPLAVATHAIFQVPWDGSERVLVVGGGTIGLAIVAAMRLFGAPAPHIAVRHLHQAEAAQALGGLPVRSGAADWPRLGGGTRFAGWAGRPLWLGGFDVVIDAVGHMRTFSQAARAVRAGGTVVRVGDVGTLPTAVDASVWAPDVRVLSPFGYGMEHPANGRAAHTFDLVLERVGTLADPLKALVTHTYALHEYDAALRTAVSHGASRSIKVAFRGAPAP